MVGGLSIAATIFQSTLRKSLSIGLEGIDGREAVRLLTYSYCGTFG
jgi:hypothetical protein